MVEALVCPVPLPVASLLAAWFLSQQGLGAADSVSGSEAHFLSHTRQLTYEGRRSGEGYFSPDGKALIFQSEREPDNPFYQIYLIDLESGEPHRVSPGFGKTTCAFFRPAAAGSAQTVEIEFASTHADPASKQLQDDELAFRASGKEPAAIWLYRAMP